MLLKLKDLVKKGELKMKMNGKNAKKKN